MEYPLNSNNEITAYFAPENITLIEAIMQNPAAYEGQAVKITGVYRGFEAGHGSPPVTESDWVIQDDTGSIYVRTNSASLKYPEDLNRPVAINGIIRLNIRIFK